MDVTAAIITLAVHVIPAGTLGMVQHVFLTHSLVTIMAVHVIPAGTLGMIQHVFLTHSLVNIVMQHVFLTHSLVTIMIQHVFLTHSLVTIMAANHLHCFLLCWYVCCHSTSCIIPSDTPFQFRQSQCPLCLPFAVFINPLKPELNPICYLLALLGAHHFLHVSRIRVKLLTFRPLMS